MANNSSYWVALGLVIAALAMPHQVLGLTIPVPWDQTTNYGDFVKKLSFAVGDVLEFTYGATHSVSQVTEANYNSCSGSSPIKHYSSGDDKVTLSTAGDYYFICPTAGHCENGMKIKVTAVAASTSPTTPATGSSPPPPASTTTPGTTDSPPPPPPPPGNGASGIKISSFVVGASFVVAAAMGLSC